MNKVILMGRLTRDPEVRYSQGSEPLAVARYTLAVNRSFKRENEPDADFIPCVAFAKRGEFAEKYFKKGQMVAVCGHLQVRTYDDPQTKQKRWATEVIVDDQYFAESKQNYESRMANGNNITPSDAYQPRTHSPAESKEEPPFFDGPPLDEDDLPF